MSAAPAAPAAYVSALSGWVTKGFPSRPRSLKPASGCGSGVYQYRHGLRFACLATSLIPFVGRQVRGDGADGDFGMCFNGSF